MIGVAEARKQGELLVAAAQESTVHQLRYELRVRGQEWLRAADDLDKLSDDDGDGTIVVVGAVCSGMRVLHLSRPDETWLFVVRKMERNGQLTLHLDVQGRPLYVNFLTETSPCVVKA